MEDKKEYQRTSTTFASTIRKGTWIEEEFRSRWYQEKTKGLWTNVAILYPDEDKKQDGL
jgi:hypothetical protein